MEIADLATFTEKSLMENFIFCAVLQRVTMSCTKSGNWWQQLTAVGHLS